MHDAILEPITLSHSSALYIETLLKLPHSKGTKTHQPMMDSITFLLVSISILLSTCLYLINPRRKPSKLPPGPRPLPIIGNLLQLGPNPHQSLAELSKKYGPLMYLKLGSKHTIVVSSPDIAKEVLQKHDQVLSSRPHPVVITTHGHHEASVVWLPSGGPWRFRRKILKEHMFSQQRLDSSQDSRQEMHHKLSDFVQGFSESGRAVDVSELAFATSLDLISSSLFSTDFDSETSKELLKIERAVFQLAGEPNVADYFPFLRFLDPQRLERKSEVVMGKLLGKFDDMVERRLGAESGTGIKDDLLEALLEISRKSGSEFTRHHVVHLLSDLFIAGTDTTSTTVEWVMAELMHNPEKMAKLKNELRTFVGENARIEEPDISKLPYLQAVLKETLRLHPAAPLLVPHKAAASVEINGYTIPKDAEILVNVWAIGRDPSKWSNPSSFEPERFLEGKVDVRGFDFELLPFGSGRRICPGMSFAYRMINLTVATLVHNFDWKLEGEERPETMDMSEKFEFSLQKAVPLKAIPVRA